MVCGDGSLLFCHHGRRRRTTPLSPGRSAEANRPPSHRHGPRRRTTHAFFPARHTPVAPSVHTPHKLMSGPPARTMTGKVEVGPADRSAAASNRLPALLSSRIPPPLAPSWSAKADHPRIFPARRTPVAPSVHTPHTLVGGPPTRTMTARFRPGGHTEERPPLPTADPRLPSPSPLDNSSVRRHRPSKCVPHACQASQHMQAFLCITPDRAKHGGRKFDGRA